MTCQCGHPRHHHAAAGVCCTITIAGPPVPPKYWGAAAELHIGRTIAHCTCSLYQPATGEQVETHTQERVVP